MIEEQTANDELLSMAEAMDFLGISRPTMYRLLERGEVKGSKVGSQWRFRQADLAAYLQRGPVAMALGTVPLEAVTEELAFVRGELARRGGSLPESAETFSQPGEAEIAGLLEGWIRLAVVMHAAEIHLEPGQQQVQVRFRIDGVLHPQHELPRALHEALVLRVKTLSGMDPLERRLPQQGSLSNHDAGRPVNLVLAIMPSVTGESVTIRVLDCSDVLIGLPRLDLHPDDLARIEGWLTAQTGLLLATGPSDCGKTTLVYSCLARLNSPERKIMTVEDPVEYLLPGLVQTQINPAVGLDFATVLKMMLANCPDVLMIGEVRDAQTVWAMVTAANSGHLVLGSLHTNDTADTIIRLLELGLEPFLLAGALRGITAQRLVRRLCDACKHPIALSEETRTVLQQRAALGGYPLPEDAVFHQAIGCDACGGHGYQGRVAVYEVLDLTPTLHAAIQRRAGRDELRRLAVEEGMPTLFADGLRKAAAGMTSIEEIMRVISE